MVDVVVSTIVSALLSGLSTGGAETAHKAVVDAYKAVRDRLGELTGGDREIADALDDVEAKPDSEERVETFKQLLVAKNVKLDDADIDRLALTLREAVRDAQQPMNTTAGRTAQIITGNYSAANSGSGTASVAHNSLPARDPQRRGFLARLFGR